MSKPRLALFDLDHTLIAGDSDVLWCEFLMDAGVLPRESFAARNADMEARYRAGTVGVEEFSNFFVSTLEGRSPAEWDTLRRRFLAERVVPRVYPQAMRVVEAHLQAGELVVMTTATNRFITELTAAHFGIVHLLATEPELSPQGVFTGRTTGTLNMRAGKVARLDEWLSVRGGSLRDFTSLAYSDSMNDLPLLEAVDEAIATNPDPKLAALAGERGWKVLSFA